MAITRTRPPDAPGAPPLATGAHRRWPRRLLIGLNIFVAMMIIATASTYGYFKYKFGQIPKIGELSELLRDNAPGEPMNVLFVGSDSRDDIADEESESFGRDQVSGQRADAIILLHVDPRTTEARMLSIPRDLWVPIHGTGKSNKINGAFNGGPKQLIPTVSEALGIPIDHYVQMDFNGFRGLVDAVGGVEMYIPSPVRDRQTGLSIPDPGCVRFDGNMALAWVRSREFQQMESGRWRVDPTADHGRIQRQQDFIRRLMREAAADAKSLNIFTIKDMVNTAVKNVQIDEEFDEDQLVGLARRFRSLEPEAVEMLTLPTTGAGIRGVSALKIKQPDAQPILDRFLPSPDPAEEPPADVHPNSVGMRVLNGSGEGGQAGDAGAGLREHGFNIRGVGDADNFGYRSSVIRYGTGQRDKALLVASKIKGGAELREASGLVGVDLVLITGADFDGIKAAGGAAPGPSASSAPSEPAPAPAAEEPTSDATAQPDLEPAC